MSGSFSLFAFVFAPFIFNNLPFELLIQGQSGAAEIVTLNIKIFCAKSDGRCPTFFLFCSLKSNEFCESCFSF